jgi:hypothetical protein
MQVSFANCIFQAFSLPPFLCFPNIFLLLLQIALFRPLNRAGSIIPELKNKYGEVHGITLPG